MKSISTTISKQAGNAFFWKGAQLVGTKLIFLGRTLVLARLLTPEDFGLLAIAMIAVDFLLSITNMGMMPALIQHPTLDPTHYHLAWTVRVGRALLISTLVFFSAPLLGDLFAEPAATPLIRLAALRPLLDALASIKLADLHRVLDFRALAFIFLGQAVVNTLVSVGLAFFVGVWALIAGILAASLTHLVLSYYYAPYRPQLQFNWTTAQPLIHFGRWIFLTSLIAVSGSAMLQWVIARRLGAAELGLYYLAAKIAFIPAEISGEVVGAVMFPLVARWQDNVRQVVGVFRGVIAGISALILPLCGLLIILAPALVANLLGEKWQGTAPLIQLLVVVNILGYFGDTVVPILQGMGKPYQVTILEVVQSSLLITLIWGLASRFGVNGAAIAWIIAIGVSQLFSAWFVRQLLSHPFATLGKPLLLVALITMAGMGLAYLINTLSPNLIGFFLAGLTATGAMALAIWWADKQFSMGIVANFYQLMPAKIKQT